MICPIDKPCRWARGQCLHFPWWNGPVEPRWTPCQLDDLGLPEPERKALSVACREWAERHLGIYPHPGLRAVIAGEPMRAMYDDPEDEGAYLETPVSAEAAREWMELMGGPSTS